MKANNSFSLRCTGLLAGALLILSGSQLSAADAKQVDAFPVFDSYIKVTGQAASISGSGASFARRTQQPDNGAGGIEALYYSKDLEGDRNVVIEGKAIAGLEDYLGKVTFSKSEFASAEIGYKQFRTFYDGIGGFFPLNKYWNPLNPQDLHLDRGEFWVGAKLTMPDKPVIEVRYSNSTRKGQKDSTSWARSDFTGIPNVPAVATGTSRGMYPTFIDINERHEVLTASVKGNIGNTSYHVEVFTDKTDDKDTRYAIVYAGEIRPYPTPSATTLVPAASMNNQQTITTMTGNKTDTFGVVANVETELSEMVKIIGGVSVSSLEGDISGNRPLVTRTPTAVGVVDDVDNNYGSLVGTSKNDAFIARLGTELKPAKDLFMKLMVGWEDEYTKSTATYNNISTTITTTTGAAATTTTVNQGYGGFKEKSWTPDFEVRYTGIANVNLYATATKKIGDGNENYASPYSTAFPSDVTLMNTEETRENYTVGGAWRASPLLTLRGEVFKKDNDNHLVGYDLGLGDNYQLQSKFTGYKLTAVAKPSSQFSFTTRYTYKKGESKVTGYLPTFPTYEALDMTVHQFGETVDWNPNGQFYMQGSLNLIYNVFGTIRGRAGIAPAGTTPAWDVNGVLANSNNNYVYGNVICGTVLSKTDDLQVQFNYYKADNYDPAIAALSMPYGAGAKDMSVTVGLKHKFTDRMIGEFKLGYIDSDNTTTGGNTNFKGPLGYVALNYAL